MKNQQTAPELTELQKKINQLIEDEAHKEDAEKILPNIKHMAIIHRWGNRNDYAIITEIKEPQQFKEVLEALPCTGTETTIGTAEDSYYHTMPTGFTVVINNEAKGAQTVKISYKSGKYYVKIEMPATFILPFISSTERKIYDCEHVYFTGYSFREIEKMRVRSYRFNCMEEISWYGGSKTLKSAQETEKIIHSLLNNQ